jgi:hypothetical protein
MPRFIQIQAVAVRVAGTGGQPYDVLEIIALSETARSTGTPCRRAVAGSN